MRTVPNSVYVVIPALNEGTVVGEVIERVRGVAANVILVDDGSNDQTAQEATRAGACVVSHSVNFGHGAAIQTGLIHALRNGATHVVTFDADGQHDPADILGLIDALNQTGADVALGSRFKGEVIGLTRQRRLLLNAARWVNFFFTGMKLSDAHNGLRAFTRAAAFKLQIRESGMAHATEIIAQVAKFKMKYVEVPVTIRYTEYSKAKGQKFSNSIHILIDLLLRGLHR
jgi:polyprenyl-phospho-N-acetylgalactosaminyl synthase